MRDTCVAAPPNHVMSGSVGAIGGRAIKFAFSKLECGLSRPAEEAFAADDVHRRSSLSWKKESGLKRVSARPLIDACAERRCFTSAWKP